MEKDRLLDRMLIAWIFVYWLTDIQVPVYTEIAA